MRLRQLVNDLIDTTGDLRLGIRTTGVYQNTTPSRFADNEEYRPTTYRVIGDILGQLEITPDDVFVDYGCGLGRVVCAAAQHPFGRVVGVELSPDLAGRAEVNVRRLRTRRAGRVEIHCANALDFDCTGATVIFFYNPFGARTLAACLERIRLVSAGARKPVRLVYSNCDTRHVMDRAPWLTMTRVLRHDRHGGERVLLYEGRSITPA